MSSKGDFFAIDSDTWSEVCGMGMNSAVSYLVMARGTGRDNVTTAWSATAAAKYSGISWRRADEAVKALVAKEIASVTKTGKHPKYALRKPETQIWLPNELVTGAGDEVPPIARLRQTQQVAYLRAFISMYGVQDLAGDGGIPRSLLYANCSVKERICNYRQFIVFGFTMDATSYCSRNGPLGHFTGKKDESGDSDVWAFLTCIEKMGLLEWVTYLAESENPDAELIHPLTGDEYADGVADAASEFANELPGGFKHEIDNYDFVLPIPGHMSLATIVKLGRLRYRPKTKLTAAWFAQHIQSCEEFRKLYWSLAGNTVEIPNAKVAGGLG